MPVPKTQTKLTDLTRSPSKEPLRTADPEAAASGAAIFAAPPRSSLDGWGEAPCPGGSDAVTCRFLPSGPIRRLLRSARGGAIPEEEAAEAPRTPRSARMGRTADLMLEGALCSNNIPRIFEGREGL